MSPRPLSIAIVGAGIGGLTAALALRRRGLSATVYERAVALGEVGAGIWIPPNAMQIYERLGLDQRLIGASWPLSAIEVRSKDGDLFQQVDLEPFRRELGFTTQSIHRATFQRILADELGRDHIRFGHGVSAVTTSSEASEPARVTFEDGSSITPDVVIGADGLRSKVREHVLPDVPLRDSGQTCFRGIARHQLPPDEAHLCREVWGDRHRLGYSALSRDEVYWFAPVTQPFETTHGGGGARDALLARYADFPETARALLAATPADRFLETPLFDFAPIDRWHRGRVVLLGDAAHATTPNVGQGAAQAAESAYVLARALATHDDVSAAFVAYEAARKEKAHHVTNLAWSLGRAAHLPQGFLTAVRDLALKATPASYQADQVHKLYGLGY